MSREIMRLLFVVLIMMGLKQLLAKPQVPCYFIFGDSLVDAGNNNMLPTSAKANYLPYGVDFPQGVTGRFTNDLTCADIIGQLLGFEKFISPFVNVTNEEISTGVNYGSGSSGIRDETGTHLGENFSLNMQLLNHKAILARLYLLQHNITYTVEYVKKCIYISVIGSNDYINNYFMPNYYATNRTYTVNQYATVLIQQYSLQLKSLYYLGARKVAVFGLGLIGCTPAEIANFGTGGKPCVEWINDEVKVFDDMLKPMVDELNNDFPDARFTYINLTSISSSGAVLPSTPCCQVGTDGLCVPNSTPCSDRNLTVFFDGFHPTDIANTVIAGRSYTASSPMDAYPYDISQLAQLSPNAVSVM